LGQKLRTVQTCIASCALFLSHLTGVAAVEPSAAKAVVEAFVAKLTALEATITTAQVTATATATAVGILLLLLLL
jgi:hypothetical protein